MSSSSGSSIRTPRQRISGLGSARSGTGHFWVQRVSAISNLILLLIAVPLIIAVAGEGHAALVEKLRNPFVAVVLVLLLFSFTFHMRIGMQVIIEDYVHTEGTKVLALIGNTFFATAVFAIGAFSVLNISFGG